MPSLSDNLKRTCDNLRFGATKQVADYEKRFSALEDLYEDLLANLVRTNFHKAEALETANRFFGKGTVRFAAVDGTMYSRPVFDVVIFFGGAYAATGSISFRKDSDPIVAYDDKTIQQNIGLSSVVPIYINEVPEVDHTLASEEQPAEVNVAKTVTDEDIANNSIIANAIMTFSEFYLALKLAANTSDDIRVILMDRSLSTERARLLYETRKTSFWRAKSSLVGYSTSGDRLIDEKDVVLSRQHVFNSELGLPPARADFLGSAVVSLLEREREKSATLQQMLDVFGIATEKRKRRFERVLERLVERHVLTRNAESYTLSESCIGSWERIKKATLEIGDALFLSKSPNVEMASSMKIVKEGKEHWLTTLDIAFLTLFSFQMLMEECWKKKILFVGITKDTAARDFKNQFIPIMYKENLLKTPLKIDALVNLPNTDRMILQSASIFNVEKVTPPWSLIEYDSAFRSMQLDREARSGYVSGAIRNKISLEKAFLKTYVQLSQAKSDPMLRSNVLLIDRLTYPEFDCRPDCTVRFRNELSDGTIEPVEVLLFKDKSVPNELQNLTMAMLIAMAPSNIPEAFGHNKPLFVADKIAKWNYNQFRCVVDSTAGLILNNHKLRKFIFYMSTFRERRTQIEQTRREHG